MGKTAEELRQNFLKRHGHLPGQPKPAASAAVPPLTPEQMKAFQEAIAGRDHATTSATATHTGLDFQDMIDAYRDRKNCGYVQAFEAILKTGAGQQAHKDFLRKKNPHIQID
jgi:hypothetical protein